MSRRGRRAGIARLPRVSEPWGRDHRPSLALLLPAAILPQVPSTEPSEIPFPPLQLPEADVVLIKIDRDRDENFGVSSPRPCNAI